MEEVILQAIVYFYCAIDEGHGKEVNLHQKRGGPSTLSGPAAGQIDPPTSITIWYTLQCTHTAFQSVI